MFGLTTCGHDPQLVNSLVPPFLFTVDAFADRPFQGNPAAVCVLNGPAEEEWMRLLAREMNLSETAFVWPEKDGFSLRWFTPSVEVDLCGHATLASAFVLWEQGVVKLSEPIRFFTRSGCLECVRDGGWVLMDFPARECVSCAPPEGLAAALGCEILWVGSNGMDFLVEVRGEEVLREIVPDFSALSRLPVRGVIVTCSARSPEIDFVSRFFAPAAGVNEDPVTGSAHCALGPFWQRRMGKSEFSAFQLSARGGCVKLSVHGSRVTLMGRAVLMAQIDLLHWPEVTPR